MTTYVSDKRVPPQGLLERVGTFEAERFHPLVQKLYDDGRIDSDLYHFYLMAANQSKSNAYDRDFGLAALIMAVAVILSEMTLTVDDLMLIPAIGKGKAERMLHINPREVEPEPVEEVVESINLPVTSLPLLTVEDEVAEILETGIFSGHSAEAQRLALIKLDEDTEVFLATEVPEGIAR